MLNEETESRNPEDNTQSTRFRSNHRLIFYFPMVLTLTNHISQSYLFIRREHMLVKRLNLWYLHVIIYFLITIRNCKYQILSFLSN